MLDNTPFIENCSLDDVRKGWHYEYITHTAVAWKYLLNIKRVPPSQWDAIVSEKMAGMAYDKIKGL